MALPTNPANVMASMAAPSANAATLSTPVATLAGITGAAVPGTATGPGQQPPPADAGGATEQKIEPLAPIPDIKNSAAYSILKKFRDYDEMNHSYLWHGASARTLVIPDDSNKQAQARQQQQQRMQQAQQMQQANLYGTDPFMAGLEQMGGNMGGGNPMGNAMNGMNGNMGDIMGDMNGNLDDNWDIVEEDISQCEEVLDQSISIIESSIKEFNIRGYGKRELESDPLYRKEKYNIKSTQQSRKNLYQFVDMQNEKYRFDPQANAIVDLVGIAHTTVFHLSKYKTKFRFSIDRHGWCRFNNKKLDSLIFWKGLDTLQRAQITTELIQCIQFYLIQKHGFHHYYYPSSEQALMAGIKDSMFNDYFTNNIKVSEQKKNKLKQKSIDNNSSNDPNNPTLSNTKHSSNKHSKKSGLNSGLTNLTDGKTVNLPYCLYSTKGWEYEIPKFTQTTNATAYRCLRPKSLYNKPLYLCVIFPDHKSHLRPGIWSRNISLFDNIVRGTMIPFVEACEDEGWAVLCLNSNEHVMITRGYNDVPPNAMEITIPLHESSRAHCNTMFKYFLRPLIRELDVKLLFVGHCQGCYDIVSLIDDNIPNGNGNGSGLFSSGSGSGDNGGNIMDITNNIIGIAMLDFYDFDVSTWNPLTLKLIEQKGAIWHSLYGINQQTYGFEPSPAKQPITTFATANKSERYGPCYNQEGIIRFFKSKIELQKTTMLR